MSILRTVFTVGCLVALSLPVAANPLSGAAAALGEDPAATYQAKLGEADAAWATMPMSAQKVLLVTYDSSGYGDYDPRPNAEFRIARKSSAISNRSASSSRRSRASTHTAISSISK